MNSSDTRYVIRAIVPGEEEQFLAHMCDAFLLDISGARPIFFNDPFFDLTHKRALFDSKTGEIISCLTIIPSAIRTLGGGLIPIAGIAGVCTSAEHRRKGFAQKLLRQTMLTLSCEFGYAAAALSTDRPDIYRRLGFEICSTVVEWTVPQGSLPVCNSAKPLSFATFSANHALISEMSELHDRVQSNHPGTFQRDAVRWQAICQFRPEYDALTVRNDGALTGFAICQMSASRLRSLDILDLTASTSEARLALLAYIRQMDDIDNVQGTCRPSDLPTLRLSDLSGLTTSRTDGVLMAILDLEACIATIAGTGIYTHIVRQSSTGLTIRLENLQSTRSRKPVRLFTVSAGPTIHGIGIAPADEMSGDWISVDAGAMAQLFFGQTSASELKKLGRLRISCEAALALAELLFPQYETFLSPIDSF